MSILSNTPSPTKFCTSCEMARPLDGGQIVSHRNRGQVMTRWKCRLCVERISASRFASKKTSRIVPKQDEGKPL